MFRRFWQRLSAHFRRGKLEREMEAELRFHLEMEAEKNIRRGMSEEEAHTEARRSFGGIDQTKESYRDLARFRWIENLWGDLHYGTRILRKSPGFTLIAVITLSLGIGANTAIFSAVNFFLFRPLPAAERPDELAAVFDGNRESSHSYANYIELRDYNFVFSGLAAHKIATAAISAQLHPGEENDQHADVIRGEIVSGDYFEVLGVRPVLGRSFTPDEDRVPNAHPLVVLSYGLWQRQFRSDPKLVGRPVYLNGSPFTVIGITPPSFMGTEFGPAMDFWAPIMMQAQLGGQADWFKRENSLDLSLLGRLKPGVTRKQAEANLNNIGQRLAEPRSFSVVSEIEGRHHGLYGLTRLYGALVLGLSALVVLVACTNVANMLLARATARSREIVIRLALGASRWRVIRQLLMESLLLALLGGALGLLLAFWGANLLSTNSPFTASGQLMVVDFSPDLRVLGWAVTVSLLTSLLFGLAPAWHATRADLIPVLKNETGAGAVGSRRLNMRNLLVIAQLAISVVVLVCAGLFIKVLYKAQTADPGFQPENLLSIRLDPGLVGYDAARARMYFTDLVRQVETLPGVRSASLTSTLPFSGEGQHGSLIVREVDVPPPPGKELGMRGKTRDTFVHLNSVGPKYFETAGTRLVLGRGFTERDRGEAPAVAIINQVAARRLYGSEQQALGKRLREGQSAWMEIVGIAKDGQLAEPPPSLLTPFLQGEGETRMTLLLRVTSANEFKSIVEGVRREARKLDSQVPFFRLKLGEEHVYPVFRALRFFAGITGALALIAAALAGVGLYGVITYAVSLRTKEIGIRMALGAQPADVLGLILHQGMLLILLGLTFGLGATFALTRLGMSKLYGMSTTDPLTYIIIVFLLTLVALLACFIPAQRATKIDPLLALRYE